MRSRTGDRCFSIESISNAHLKRLSELAAEEGLLNQGQSYSIAIHCEGKRIVYSGDIKSVMELRPLLREEADLLILEMAHFMPDDFLMLLEDVCPRMTVFTHFHPDLDIEPEKSCMTCFMVPSLQRLSLPMMEWSLKYEEHFSI